MSQRIEYIDALRGFTMILVVFHHIALIGMDMPTETSVCSSLFVLFRMPLFFFISGFIAYRANEIWNGKNWMEKVKKKMLIQLIPTIVFGLLFTYTVKHEGIGAFVMTRWKFGYWFTISLLEMFIIYYSANYFIAKLPHQGGGNERTIPWVLGGLAILLYLLQYSLKHLGVIDQQIDPLSIQNTFAYFQFFVFGNLAARFCTTFTKILDGKYFSTYLIGVFVISFIGILELQMQIGRSSLHYLLLCGLSLLCNYSGLLIVFAFFRHYQASFIQSTALGSALQYIGRRTLDIYMIHQFLLPHLPKIGEYFRAEPNFTIELATGIGLSLLVIGLCLIISNVIRLSEPLGCYLFGAKPNTK